MLHETSMSDSKEPANTLRSMVLDMGVSIPRVQAKPFVPRILIVDDEPALIEDMAKWLRHDGYQVEAVSSAEEALQAFGRKTYHLVLLDAFLPGHSAIELVHLLQDRCFGCMVVLLIGPAPLQAPPEVLRLHSVPCLSKPLSAHILRKRIHDLVEKSPREPINRLLATERTECMLWEGMCTRSPLMQTVFTKIRSYARADSTILIHGEDGTGKEIAARAIHNQSSRSKGPFVVLRTKSIARDKIGLELFGKEDGGADINMLRGKLHAARGGTLFVDEIAMLDERTQLRFLRLLETPQGATTGQRSMREWDVRIITATRYDLVEQTKEKTLPATLVDQLKAAQLILPSLQQRPEDIMPLAYDFLAFFAMHYRKLISIITPEARRTLEAYSWPGNIRELRHVIEQAVLLSKNAEIIPELLPYRVYHATTGGRVISIPMGLSLAQAEKEIILKTLENNEHNKKGTAEILGISRRCLYNKLAEYGHLLSPGYADA